MDCPECGQPVLVEHGAITPHLNPDTLQSCSAKAPKAQPADPPAPKPAKKTPTKAKS